MTLHKEAGPAVFAPVKYPYANSLQCQYLLYRALLLNEIATLGSYAVLKLSYHV